MPEQTIKDYGMMALRAAVGFGVIYLFTTVNALDKQVAGQAEVIKEMKKGERWTKADAQRSIDKIEADITRLEGFHMKE